MRAPGGQRRAAVAALLCITALGSPAGAASRPGIEVFGQTCAVCHFADSTERKVGPGLQGLYPRARLPVSGDVVTDARVAQQIRRGSGAMPPHPHLTETDVTALLGYLRTL
jgi:cytochrome c2